MATVKLDPAKGVQIPNLTTTERNAINLIEIFVFLIDYMRRNKLDLLLSRI